MLLIYHVKDIIIINMEYDTIIMCDPKLIKDASGVYDWFVCFSGYNKLSFYEADDNGVLVFCVVIKCAISNIQGKVSDRLLVGSIIYPIRIYW